MTVPTSLLLVVMVVEAGVVAVVAAAILGHAVLLGHRQRADEARLEPARSALARQLAQPRESDPEPELTRLPPRLRERLVLEAAQSLAGGRRRRLATVAGRLGVRAAAARELGSRLWFRRLHGVRLLAQVFGDDDALTHLLGDPHPAVRAEAITWAGDNVDADRADRLITLLGDASRLCRTASTDALVRAGPAAAPTIARRLGGPGEPNRPELLRVAAARPDPRYEDAAADATGDPRPEARAAAARLLGALGGTQAVEALGGLLVDPDPAVRRSASTALGRLGHWPSGPAVARLLRDPQWDVRRAAGEALALLGAPGHLLLERYARDADPFAADMATRIIQTAQLYDQPRTGTAA